MAEWYWEGRDRLTDKIEKFYTKGPYGTEAELRDHLGEHYPGLQFVRAWPADKAPAIVRPVNRRYFQHGIINLALRELSGYREPRRDRSFLAPILPNPLDLERKLNHGKDGFSTGQRSSDLRLISDRFQCLRIGR
jgi:hypothetical protein